MPKPKPIQITIPNPCHQSWDEMTPEGEGRHCAHCQNVVTDFTKWSDTALYDFFTKNKNACGRFSNEQLHRGILRHQPHSKLYTLFVSLGLTLVLFESPAQQVFAKPPMVYAQTQDKGEPANSIHATDSVVYIDMKGVVVNNNGEPIIGAVIKVERYNIPNYVDMVECGGITNVDGSFMISIPTHDEKLNGYFLSINHNSYSGEYLSLRNFNTKEDTYVEFKLHGYVYGGVSIVELPTPIIEHPYLRPITPEQMKKCKR